MNPALPLMCYMNFALHAGIGSLLTSGFSKIYQSIKQTYWDKMSLFHRRHWHYVQVPTSLLAMSTAVNTSSEAGIGSESLCCPAQSYSMQKKIIAPIKNENLRHTVNLCQSAITLQTVQINQTNKKNVSLYWERYLRREVYTNTNMSQKRGVSWGFSSCLFGNTLRSKLCQFPVKNSSWKFL